MQAARQRKPELFEVNDDHKAHVRQNSTRNAKFRREPRTMLTVPKTMLNVPQKSLNQHLPHYPYIIYSKDTAKRDEEQTLAPIYIGNDISGIVEITLKPVEVSYMWSTPFGKHNSAHPEMKYKTPGAPRDNHDYWRYADNHPDGADYQ